MDASSWIRSFRALHQRVRQGNVPDDERRLYDASKEQFARSLVAAQGLTVAPGESARRSFRVALVFRIELSVGGRRVKAATLDVSVGGFSARLDQAPDLNQLVEFSLFVPGDQDPIVGKAKAVGARNLVANARVSFAFEGLPERGKERLENVLFDAVLARLPE